VRPQLNQLFKKLPTARTKTRVEKIRAMVDEKCEVEPIGVPICATNYIKAFIKTFIMIVPPVKQA